MPAFDAKKAKENIERARLTLAQEERNGSRDASRAVGIKSDILAKYNDRERDRIDRLKKDMEDGKTDDKTGIKHFGFEIQSQYEHEKIDIPPINNTQIWARRTRFFWYYTP